MDFLWSIDYGLFLKYRIWNFFGAENMDFFWGIEY